MTNRSRGSGFLLCTDPSNRKWCETASASQLFHGIRNWSFGRQSGIASSGHENEGSPAGNTNTVINLVSEGSHLERGSTPSHLFGGPVSKLGWNISECFPTGSSLLTGHQNSTVSLSETGSNRGSAGNRTVFYSHIKALDTFSHNTFSQHVFFIPGPHDDFLSTGNQRDVLGENRFSWHLLFFYIPSCLTLLTHISFLLPTVPIRRVLRDTRHVFVRCCQRQRLTVELLEQPP